MEYTNPDGIELTMSCIVFTLYIVGKVWMYYHIEDTKETKKSKPNKGVIKRGTEWPE